MTIEIEKQRPSNGTLRDSRTNVWLLLGVSLLGVSLLGVLLLGAPLGLPEALLSVAGQRGFTMVSHRRRKDSPPDTDHYSSEAERPLWPTGIPDTPTSVGHNVHLGGGADTVNI
ncbi:hypothetical protein EYF80_065585 [Liparis tanakae]|uniref:Uncharacterized protein n=1 Tax=Liparis tanakae TaxID=230148 RepID=A0A4Z2E7K7_9TELE|nr:hypothetical protein EYF80_065585 [Liparis tanakae]